LRAPPPPQDPEEAPPDAPPPPPAEAAPPELLDATVAPPSFAETAGPPPGRVPDPNGANKELPSSPVAFNPVSRMPTVNSCPVVALAGGPVSGVVVAVPVSEADTCTVNGAETGAEGEVVFAGRKVTEPGITAERSSTPSRALRPKKLTGTDSRESLGGFRE